MTMNNTPDVYTKAINSLAKTQQALLNEISIADGRARLHAPTFYYVCETIKAIKELQMEAYSPKIPATTSKVEAPVVEEIKPVAKKATIKK